MRDPADGGGYGATLVRALPNTNGGSDIYRFECLVDEQGDLAIAEPQHLTRSNGATCAEPLYLPIRELVVFRQQRSNRWRLMQTHLHDTETQPVFEEQPQQVQQVRLLDASTLLLLLIQMVILRVSG